MAYPGADDKEIKNDVLYNLLLLGLRDKTLAEKLIRDNEKVEKPSFHDSARKLFAATDDHVRKETIAQIQAKEQAHSSELQNLKSLLSDVQREVSKLGKQQNKFYQMPAITQQLPLVQSARRQYHETRACFTCGKIGHLSRNCYRNRQNTAGANVSHSIKSNQQPLRFDEPVTYQLSNISQYSNKYVNINVNEQSVFALVDTGAAATIVSKRLFDTCAAELKTKNRNIRFVGADGTDIPILGVAELHFIVAGCDTIAEAFISENINETCILGIDFLQKNQCEVNYADMTLSSCGGSLPLLKAPKMKNSCDVFLIDSLVLEPLTEIDVPCKVACRDVFLHYFVVRFRTILRQHVPSTHCMTCCAKYGHHLACQTSPIPEDCLKRHVFWLLLWLRFPHKTLQMFLKSYLCRCLNHILATCNNNLMPFQSVLSCSPVVTFLY